MGTDRKYGKITVSKQGSTGPIGKDEPVFLLRAQDAHSVTLIRLYASLCEQTGSTDEHVAGCNAVADEMARWQDDNGKRLPGMDPDAPARPPAGAVDHGNGSDALKVEKN